MSRSSVFQVPCTVIAMASLVWALSGCASKPFRAIVGGGMKINGDMGVDGKMKMSGEVVTSTRVNNTATPIRAIVVDGSQDAACGVETGKVAIVDIDGFLDDHSPSGIGSMGENPVALFREKLRRIESDGSIRAVVLRINSPGGGVTASDIMAHDLDRLKQSRRLPVVACLMTTGTGGGYYLATHADWIVTHPTTIVGGIGVILNTYNMTDTLAQYNIASIPVKAGEKIDTGSPERTMKKEERALLQAMADGFHRRFIDQVRAARGGRLIESEQPTKDGVFDGRVVSGEESVRLGLTDQIGYLDDAIDTAASQAGLPANSPVVMLRRDNDRALSEFDVTPNSGMASILPLNIPGLDRSSMPTFNYLWQPEPALANSN